MGDILLLGNVLSLHYSHNPNGFKQGGNVLILTASL